MTNYLADPLECFGHTDSEECRYAQCAWRGSTNSCHPRCQLQGHLGLDPLSSFTYLASSNVFDCENFCLNHHFCGAFMFESSFCHVYYSYDIIQEAQDSILGIC